MYEIEAICPAAGGLKPDPVGRAQWRYRTCLCQTRTLLSGWERPKGVISAASLWHANCV
jgi:hypothetical protein